MESPNPPTRMETLHTLRVANMDVAFSTAFVTLVTGAFLVGLVKLLGGGDHWIGVVTAIPALMGIMQIPGAIIAKRYSSYKRYVTVGAGIWRILYVFVAILPLLAWANEVRLFILVACITIAAFSVSLVNSTYSDWLAELVPPNSRGWYFSRRHAIGTGIGAAVGLAGGFLLDRFKDAGKEAVGYSMVYGLGVACAAVSLAFFLKMRDLQRPKVEKQTVRQGLGAFAKPFRDRDFRKVLVFMGMFFLGQTFAGNLYSAFALETLKMPFIWIQAVILCQAATTIASSKLWGFLADRYGNKPCLILSGIGIAISPVGWIVTRPDNLTFSIVALVLSHLFMGVFWCGVAVTQFNLLLATAKAEDRASYIGSGMAVQSMVSGIAPLAGAELMAQLRGVTTAEQAYKGVFLAVLILRGLAVFFLAPVKEEGSSQVKRTLRDLRKVTPRGMRAMRSLTKSTDVQTRVEAIQNVGQEGFAMASDQIVKALGDPSPRIRRNAARAMARLGDPRLADHLIDHVKQHPDLVEEETIEAMGDLGSTSSVPILIELLQSPRSLLRRAAAKSLARLESPNAIQALTAAAQEKDDPDLRRSSIQALRILEARDAGPAIFDALFDPHPSVRIAAAEAVAELGLSDGLPYVRQALAYYEDEAASELAYALGSIGSLDVDLATILGEAAKQRTRTARRRCLLGAARLLDVEAPVYRLLLSDGFERDAQLLNLLQSAMRANRRIRTALDAFGAGNEAGALETLHKIRPTEELRLLADSAVDESFLIAACLVAE
jgi:MFS family permease